MSFEDTLISFKDFPPVGIRVIPLVYEQKTWTWEDQMAALYLDWRDEAFASDCGHGSPIAALWLNEPLHVEYDCQGPDAVR